MGSGGGGGGGGGVGLHNPSLELDDPTPDVWALFGQFDTQFFGGRLGGVTVEWSKRMTSCAGLCYYQGRVGGCRIKLSEPLLQLRPRTDLIDTLIHEMIHAYIFITGGYSKLDRDGHGKDFQELMHTINAVAGTNITIYHSFHDEVEHFRKHWWLCDGPCATRPPFFGLVKRAMNRAPGPSDRWWRDHAASCSGKFNKIKEPPPKLKAKVNVNKGKGKGKGGAATTTTTPITNFFNKKTDSSTSDGASGSGGRVANQSSSASASATSPTPTATGATGWMGVDASGGDPVINLDGSDDEEDEDFKMAIALSLQDANKTPATTPTPPLHPPPAPAPPTTSGNSSSDRFPGTGYRLGG